MSESALLNLGAWSLQVGLITLAAAAVSYLVRVDTPAIRYAWWRAVLVACLALPLLQPRQPTSVLPLEAPTIGTATPSSDTPAAAPSTVPLESVLPAATPRWDAIVTTVLLTGALVRLSWLAAGLLGLRRLRRHGRQATAYGPGEELLEALHAAGAEVRCVPSLHQPVTFGAWKPVVLLPDRLPSMPAGVQQAVLAHELWHVRRRDWLWSLAEELLLAVFWFHPAIWYLVSRVQGAREEVVDDLSILATNDRRGYLEALLAFADEPAVSAAAPFIQRRQLFNRMMLIAREGVMSSKRIVASCAGMAGALLAAAWFAGAAFPLTAGAAMMPPTLHDQQPRDPRPAPAQPEATREAELASLTAADPSNAKHWLELAKLQEDRGGIDEAERTLRSGLNATSGSREIAMGLTRFFTRQGQFEKSVAILEDLAAQDPTDASGHQLVATYYWEKAQKDHRITPADKLHYIDSGIRATDRALAQNPDYVEALTYKNILLRMKGNLEANAATRARLYAEADALRTRAIELARTRTAAPRPAAPAGAPPPPPPPPPPSQHYQVDGQRAVRVGGDIEPPEKIHQVDPVYPEDARAARAAGTVTIELLIDTQGLVRSMHVLRSIPLFDQAAMDAVKQWRFAPTLREGVPVPVLMPVTVSFTPQ